MPLALGMKYLCPTGEGVDPLWCVQNVLVLAMSLVSLVCVSIVLARILVRRCKKKPGPDTSMGRIMEHLVVTLCVLDLLYHFPDIFFSMDKYAPKMYRLVKSHASGRDFDHSMGYFLFREAFGAMDLLWHCVIGRTMYEWIVLKSAMRVSYRRLYYVVGGTAAFTLLRILVWIKGGRRGLLAAVLLYDAVLVPGCIFVMMRWYLVVAVALYREGVEKPHGGEAGRDGQPASPDSTAGAIRLQCRMLLLGCCCFVPPTQGGQKLLPRFVSPSPENSREASDPTGRGMSSDQWRGDRHLEDIQEEELYDMESGDSASRGSRGRSASGAKERDRSFTSDPPTSHLNRSMSERSSGDREERGGVVSVSLDAATTGGGTQGDVTQQQQHPPRATGNVWRQQQHKRRSNRRRSRRRPPPHFTSRHLPILRRLMSICLAVSCVWTVVVILDLITWADYFTPGVWAPVSVYLLRILVLRTMGFLDACLLGGLCARNQSAARNQASVASQSKATTMAPQGGLAPGAKGPLAGGAGVNEAGVPVAEKDDGPPEEATMPPSLATSRSSSMPGGRRGMMAPPLTSRDSSGSLRWPPSLSQRSSNSNSSIGAGRRLDLSYRQISKRPGSIKVFATTWNMGRVPSSEVKSLLPAELPKWIPHGYDLYIVGLQECLALKEVKTAINEYLDDSPYSPYVGGYTAFQCEIGDTPVPLTGIIAVILYARSDHVDDGAFRVNRGNKVAAGVALGPMGRASNKGIVGISVRYFDCNLALVSAHLAAGSRLTRRIDDARRTLKELHLLGETELFDVHLQHHHVLILGDLNYRMKASPDTVLSLVSNSAACEDTGSGWRDLSFAKFDVVSAKGFPPERRVEASTLGMQNGWPWIESLDELCQCMADKQIFYNFREGPISFPPSYRWRRHATPLSYLDPDVLEEEAYTTHVRVQQPNRSAVAATARAVVAAAAAAGGGGNEGSITTSTADDATTNNEPCPPTVDDGDFMVSYNPSVGFRARLHSGVSRRRSATPMVDLYVDDDDDEDQEVKSGTDSTPFTDTNVEEDLDVGDQVAALMEEARRRRPGQIRTPSYTDRVLTHSLPGWVDRLVWRHYDMIDGVTISDHRPVAAALELEVDTAVRGFMTEETQPQGLPQQPSGFFRSLMRYNAEGDDDLCTFTIRMQDPKWEPVDNTRLVFTGTISGDNAAESAGVESGYITPPEPTTPPMGIAQTQMQAPPPPPQQQQQQQVPHELTLHCPQAAQDPMAFRRKAECLSNVIPGVGSASSVSSDPSNASGPGEEPRVRYALRHFAWASFPVRHKVVASARFSEHLLMKLTDSKGSGMGQGVVLLKEIEGRGWVRTRIDMTSGGELRGYLTVDIKVKLGAAV